VSTCLFSFSYYNYSKKQALLCYYCARYTVEETEALRNEVIVKGDSHRVGIGKVKPQLCEHFGICHFFGSKPGYKR
jgi:hypothetical protein